MIKKFIITAIILSTAGTCCYAQPKNKSIISESLLECNLKDSTRAEELDINDFEKLTLTLINKNVIK